MMKKHYIQPSLEIVPFGAMVSLCNSGGGGGTSEEIISGNGGENPWTGGMSPRRTPAF